MDDLIRGGALRAYDPDRDYEARGRQCDAAELLLATLSMLEASEEPCGHRRTIVQELVCGVLFRKRKTCLLCGITSDGLEMHPWIEIGLGASPDPNLVELLANIEQEELREELRCEDASCAGAATFRQYLEREPPMLILRVKRFDALHQKDRRPLSVLETLTSMRSGHYHIAAIVTHSGSALQNGHYVAYCWNGQSSSKSEYTKISDDTVSAHDWCQVARETARAGILYFYARDGYRGLSTGDGSEQTPYWRDAASTQLAARYFRSSLRQLSNDTSAVRNQLGSQQHSLVTKGCSSEMADSEGAISSNACKRDRLDGPDWMAGQNEMDATYPPADSTSANGEPPTLGSSTDEATLAELLKHAGVESSAKRVRRRYGSEPQNGQSSDFCGLCQTSEQPTRGRPRQQLASNDQSEASHVKRQRCDGEDKLQDSQAIDETEKSSDEEAAQDGEWMGMFNLKVDPEITRRTSMDIEMQVAKKLADHLRSHPVLPADPSDAERSWLDVSSGGRLPTTHCAFKGCMWCASRVRAEDLIEDEDDPEHPWDQLLRTHVLEAHEAMFAEVLPGTSFQITDAAFLWDLYKEAIAVKERLKMPDVGPSVDRRTFERTVAVYNDTRIQSLICFSCAQVWTDTGRARSEIEFCSGAWLLGASAAVLRKMFSMDEFEKRYCQEGSPLFRRAAPGGTGNIAAPDFSDWQIMLHAPSVLEFIAAKKVRGTDAEALQDLMHSPLICCPEDACCSSGTHDEHHLCTKCQMPICKACRVQLQTGCLAPQCLANDNWYGYVQKCIYEMGVTWMEKTVASPFWTGITVFAISKRKNETRQHMMHEQMYRHTRRIAAKGQVFSAPMDWRSTLEQLESIDAQETAIALPHTGAILATKVRVCLTSGLVDLNKSIKQATVRREVVVQLIRMWRDSGHPDYRGIDMGNVEARARQLAPVDDPNEPVVPAEVLEILEDGDSDREEELEAVGTDKAATPASRPRTWVDLQKTMEQVRPNMLVAQRDSDALQEVEASRQSAFARFSSLSIGTGSTLLDQFHTSYIPRVFHLTLPWLVGGPDFRGKKRYRRESGDAPPVDLKMFTQMIARRVEAQIRWDWELTPAAWSLTFASKVNLGVSLSIQRFLRAGEVERRDEKNIGMAAAKIYQLLASGEFHTPDGGRAPLRGDVSKLLTSIGLTNTQKALIRNYQFMSARVEGTRQIRRMIGHKLTGARVAYGTPVFMTVTPNERHSSLMIRLTRYRRNDPGITIAHPEFRNWIGRSKPSLGRSTHANVPEKESVEVEVEIPDFELRRLMINKDALCSVEAYRVWTKVVLPALFGFRMCPNCPHCATGPNPCTDRFGSNATPIGGCCGRADAFVGATEAQKAEGVLHLHFFLFLQMCYQFTNLLDIVELIKQKLLDLFSTKNFVDHCRCAAYPDLDQFESNRTTIEAAWPAYPEDTTLSRLPPYIFDTVTYGSPCDLYAATSVGDWRTEGAAWKDASNARRQHVLSHMNHHIHPVVNHETGERKPLPSCCAKDRPNQCKSGFPLESHMTREPVLLCSCIASARGLPTSGSRSVLSTILPSRNEPNLNATHPAWAEFSGCNGDIKFPFCVPVIPETHESHDCRYDSTGIVPIWDVRRCCGKVSLRGQAESAQLRQTAIAGYFGGYTAKMQPIGKKELAALNRSLEKHAQTHDKGSIGANFISYSKRMVRDLEAKGIVIWLRSFRTSYLFGPSGIPEIA